MSIRHPPHVEQVLPLEHEQNGVEVRYGHKTQSGDIPEITPEMIEMGYRVLAESGITDELLEADRLLVERIYRATAASCRQK